MSVARLAGRVAGGSTGPVVSFLPCGWYSCWSAGLGQGGDPCPGGYQRVGPGPCGGDFEVPAAATADQARGSVGQPVAQGLRLGDREDAVPGGWLEPEHLSGR